VSDPRFAAPASGYYWEVWQGARPVMRSDSLSGGDLTSDRLHGFDTARTSAKLDPNGASFNFMVAGDTRDLVSVMERFHLLLASSLGIIALGLCAAAAAQVSFGLRPLRRLRMALAEVRGGRAASLSDDFPEEVRPLVRDLNALIVSQSDMVRRARAQAGNLGHALRTPLAILMAEARRLRAAGQLESADAILAECRAMTRQVDYQVARAHAAASRAGPAAYASPAVEANKVIGAMQKLWAGRTLIYRNDIPPDLMVGVNPDDLSEILGNLIDNAAKWAGREVRVTAKSPEAGGVLLVEDDGPGIPPEKRAAVFDAGERLDERKPGSGLGLAIVKDLVGLYGGNVTLGQSELGGLSVAVTLPIRS
jgi:signal transduction histidine kinase